MRKALRQSGKQVANYDPKTGKFTEYSLPPVPDGDIPGARDVTVDKEDNIWAVDEGTDMLVKFSPDGRVLMTIGRRMDPVMAIVNMPGTGGFHGRNEKYRFGRETDVAFDQQGNTIVLWAEDFTEIGRAHV